MQTSVQSLNQTRAEGIYRSGEWNIEFSGEKLFRNLSLRFSDQKNQLCVGSLINCCSGNKYLLTRGNIGVEKKS